MARDGRRPNRIEPGLSIAPNNVSEVLQRLRSEPQSTIVAGGTWLLSRLTDEARHPQGERPASSIVSLHQVRELRRLVRTGNHVEIGATLPVGRLLASDGRRFIPPVLTDVLAELGPPPVRNLATLGGALSIRETQLPVAVLLQLMDARVEYRRQGHSRWAALATAPPQQGELLSRVRIPTASWTHWFAHSWGTVYPEPRGSVSLIALASLDKTGIDRFRCAIIANGDTLIRPRQAETDLVGRGIPLSERDIVSATAVIEKAPAFGTALDDAGRWRATHGVEQFLRALR